MVTIFKIPALLLSIILISGCITAESKTPNYEILSEQVLCADKFPTTQINQNAIYVLEAWSMYETPALHPIDCPEKLYPIKPHSGGVIGIDLFLEAQKEAGELDLPVQGVKATYVVKVLSDPENGAITLIEKEIRNPVAYSMPIENLYIKSARPNFFD